MIHGRFSNGLRGVRIDAQLQLHPFMIIVSLVWLALVGMFAVAGVKQIATTGEVGLPALMPLALVLLYALTATIGFTVEARRAKELLRQLFEAEVV